MHNWCRVGPIIALTVLAMAGPRAAQQPAGPVIDVEALGPQVGATVPDFSLPDQHGTARSLKSLMGPKGAILVFFRSADW
jgi:cytochrome oxidase Cu insertion factor (SCO1/SenC/PrrC family)